MVATVKSWAAWVAVAVAVSVSGAGAESGPFTVTFSTGNGSAIPPKLVSYGDTVAKPADPVRDGYVFDYWWLDAPPSNPLIGVMPSAWDFSTPITSDMTLIIVMSDADYNDYFIGFIFPKQTNTIGNAGLV